MSWKASYFSVAHLNPGTWIESLFHPYSHREEVRLRGKGLVVHWTGRADRELARRDAPLVVEMQLLYTCVVKKRVIFDSSPDLAVVPVGPRLHVGFRMAQASSCDPLEFATRFPVKRELIAERAQGVCAKLLRLDFHEGAWSGEFQI